MRNGPYELITAPVNYPGKRYRGKYAYEHRVEFWKANGYLPEEVHHKDEAKRNNCLSNLEGVTGVQHKKHHGRLVSERKLMVDLQCSWCSAQFKVSLRAYKQKVKVRQERFYCCRSHQVSDQQRRRFYSLVV